MTPLAPLFPLGRGSQAPPDKGTPYPARSESLAWICAEQRLLQVAAWDNHSNYTCTSAFRENSPNDVAVSTTQQPWTLAPKQKQQTLGLPRGIPIQLHAVLGNP